MDELLQKVKTALRISHAKLDDDILDNIQACLLDLQMHGVVHKDHTDALIQNAIKLYCRAEYTDDPAKAEKYGQRYREMRNCLKLAEGYGWKDEVVLDD
jgi:hypothetical protein